MSHGYMIIIIIIITVIITWKYLNFVGISKGLEQRCMRGRSQRGLSSLPPFSCAPPPKTALEAPRDPSNMVLEASCKGGNGQNYAEEY